jgi:hypothetical protein
MPRFKVTWSGTIFVTSFINADNKEKAMQKAEDGNLELDNIDEINDIEIEECNEVV